MGLIHARAQSSKAVMEVACNDEGELIVGVDVGDVTIGTVDQGDAGVDPWKVDDDATQTLLGALDETAPATDTASSGANGRLQRIAQRLTSILSVLTGGATAGTATLANVNDSASNQTLQAANANRLGWSCFNDSTSDLYVKFGATATSTSFTVKVLAAGYYEMPKPIYTGIIDGIWTVDAVGAARVTELTA